MQRMRSVAHCVSQQGQRDGQDGEGLANKAQLWPARVARNNARAERKNEADGCEMDERLMGWENRHIETGYKGCANIGQHRISSLPYFEGWNCLSYPSGAMKGANDQQATDRHPAGAQHQCQNDLVSPAQKYERSHQNL
ncbi:hypothetical protein SBA_ch1_28030 [Sphingomonas bisphenolicum]|uniref:Uncharacterized protein n=1 Tax=Sphingomonas bisphenolicum TaxID=296544 RepID=A0ABN5WKX2_9SPHN|nr:hypothetical protein SBA_ch1_28030 [Sphingomonas bisphenolicum]